jgi:hypothetical protein
MSGPEADGDPPPRDLTTPEAGEAAGVTADRIRGLAYQAGTTPPAGKRLPGRKVNGDWLLEFAAVKAYVESNRGSKPKVPLGVILRRPVGYRAKVEATASPQQETEDEIAKLKARLDAAEARLDKWQRTWAEQRRITLEERRPGDRSRAQLTYLMAGMLAAVQSLDSHRLGEIYDLEDQLLENLTFGERGDTT